ncbi:MAG: hypothetical protein ABSF18_07110, partial [Gammaproteobacteria bacterium]
KPWPKTNQKTVSNNFPSLTGIRLEYRFLIQQCWHTDPLQRPDAQTILQKIKNLKPATADELDSSYTEAQTLEAHSKYEDAALIYEQDAKQGHSKSAYCLGMLYANKKLSSNQHAMLYYLRQSANANYYRAEYNLARVYEKGELAPQNAEQALMFYQKVVDNPSTPDDIRTSAKNKIATLSLTSDLSKVYIDPLKYKK